MKKWNIVLLITLSVLSASIHAEAATWELIGGTKNIKAFIDTESISGGPNGPKECWIKYELAKPNCTVAIAKSKNKCFSSMISLAREDNNKTYCDLQQTYYFTDGTDQSTTLTCKYKNIIPGSLGEKIWKYLYPATPSRPVEAPPTPEPTPTPEPPPVREPSSGTDAQTEP